MGETRLPPPFSLPPEKGDAPARVCVSYDDRFVLNASVPFDERTSALFDGDVAGQTLETRTSLIHPVILSPLHSLRFHSFM